MLAASPVRWAIRCALCALAGSMGAPLGGALLAAGLPYVGLLGPRARTENILREIGAGPGEAERVFGPVGLDLGADGPRQVALSIVAELLAFIAQREPRHLSERKEPIHAV